MQNAAASGPLVPAKFRRNSGSAGVLRRSRLAPPREFVEGTCSVALIAAPAGYGKTTLMGLWHDLLIKEGMAGSWLSLDPDDEDPARLMRHLVAALQELNPEIGGGALAPLTADLSAGIKPALESLAADLDLLPGRSILFLDDLHFLSGDAAYIINWLINFAPQKLQFVLGSRQRPPLRLGSLRVRRKLVELGPLELQFSMEEAAEFYAARLGAPLDRRDLQQLLIKTEGWPAALELAALALRSETDRTALIDRFTGTARGIVDYLGEAVMLGLDQSTREFLMHTALFERICAPLAAVVTDEIETGELLASLVARNLFLLPLDPSGEWYRYHHLAAQFFRDRLRREGGKAAPVLLRGAAWLHQDGHIEEAINAAIRAKAWETAVRWIAEAVEELVYRRGYHHTIMHWMTQVPASWVDRHPTIRIHYAYALAFSPEQQEVEAQVHRLEKIRSSMLKTADSDHAVIDQIDSAIELQKVLSGALRDERLGTRADAQTWLERWPEAPLIRRATMAHVLAFGHKTAGEIDQGLEWIAQAKNWLAQIEGWYGLAWSDYLGAVLYMKRGAYFEARNAAQAGLDLLRRKLNGLPAHAALLHAVLATVAYEFDELDGAREHLEHCMLSLSESGQADAVLMAYMTAAKLERLEHGEYIGLKRLREGQDLGARRGLTRVTISLAAEECHWHGRAGRYEEARRVAARQGFEELPKHPGESTLRSTKAFLVASRYLLRRTPKVIITEIEGPLARCREKGLYRRWVELLLMKTIAHNQNGELGKAEQCLYEALTIAAPHNYFRTILDEGVDLAATLDRLKPAQLLGSTVAPLVRRLQQAPQHPSESKQAAAKQDAMMVEELSKRELTILKRLESGLSRKEIADSIFISEGTLKWHTQNIYGKLGVKNRSGAITKAKALNLI